MNLSTRSRYGVRALLDIALQTESKPVLLREIAKRQNISEKYLERIMAILKGAKLVHSARGSGGGYSLGMAPEDITLDRVVSVLENQMELVACIDDPESCDRSMGCVTREIWVDMRNAMEGTLSSWTLKSVVERHRQKNPEKGHLRELDRYMGTV